MGLFKKFKVPKGKIEVQLDEVAYEATDKFTGRIVVDSQEDLSVDEFRLEFGGKKKVKWKKGFSRLSTTSSLETKKIPIGGSVNLEDGQHFERPFQIDIPFYSKPDPFTEIEVNVKGVAAVQGRPDLTHEVKPVINFPYVIGCLSEYGGCGFVTEPLKEPVKICPKCGNNLEEVWNRKYKNQLKKTQARSGRF